MNSLTSRPGSLYDLNLVANVTRQGRGVHPVPALRPYDANSVAEHSRQLSQCARPMASPSLYDLGAARPAARR